MNSHEDGMLNKSALEKKERGFRRVVCSACRCIETGHLIIGPRHFDSIMRSQLLREKDHLKYKDQGFIDQWGIYMSRTEAWKVAEAAGQILYRCGGDEADGGTLYSENLY